MMGLYSTQYNIGPLPHRVKCPRCNGPATLSSHNHILRDADGKLIAVWMPAGWYCRCCNIIFCGICKGNPLEHHGGDEIDIKKLLEVEILEETT